MTVMKTSSSWLVLAVALAIGSAPRFAMAQCDTVIPPHSVDLDSVRVFQFQSSGANCWGYKAPDGRHYAIMGGGRSIGFIDVQTMTIVDTVPANPCQWRELKTYRNYCYAVSECTGLNQGMMIIDMQFLPDSVHYVGSYTSGTNIRSHCISIDTARGYCYLVRQNYSGFRIVNLANPIAPVEVGTGVTTGDLHDMTAFNDTVYAAEGNDHGFSIWDCTNKLAPQMLATVTIPGSGNYVHNLWPTEDHKYLASTEELPDFRTMKMWNMEDKGNIYMVDQYIGPGGLPHNAHIEGDYLFLAHYSSGFSVLDISNPTDMSEVGLFDTYLTSNNPDFVGCWGVYPHTDGSGWVYASNIDGRMFILTFAVEPLAASAEFFGGPTVGQVPLNVAFDACGPDLTEWRWSFGDGDSGFVESPTHAYAQPGSYDVSLFVSSPSGSDSLVRTGYVFALAESLLVADTGFDRGTQVVWGLDFTNNVPISEFKVPVSVSDVPSYATFDSISYVGCRTDYFELKQIIYDARSTGQIIVQLKARFGGMSPDLAPGSGPIAKVYLTIKPSAQPGDSIMISTPTIGVHSLTGFTAGQPFAPISPGAFALIGPPCDCSCHGDPICDGSPNVQDVVRTTEVAFRGTPATIDPTCPHEGRTDINCSGQTDIVDVVLITDVAFRGADPATTICNPCL